MCGPFALTLDLASVAHVDQSQQQVQPNSAIYGLNFITGDARVLMGNAGGDVARGLFQPETV